MPSSPLNSKLLNAVLERLSPSRVTPDLAGLDSLLGAYTRCVPWESAFRIVKKGSHNDPSDCPRWPEEFWLDNLERGGGGTCFESNYAFYALLLALGFRGYLTINNMGDSIGCHTAIVLMLDGSKWLVDAGLPLHAPLPLNPSGVTGRRSPFFRYSVKPEGAGCYEIERNPHPLPYAFTLVDRPVSDAIYRAATAADYGENGLFLDRVIVNRVIGERLWRFNAGERPWRFDTFTWGEREEHIIVGDPSASVAQRFGMKKEVITNALRLTGV